MGWKNISHYFIFREIKIQQIPSLQLPASGDSIMSSAADAEHAQDQLKPEAEQPKQEEAPSNKAGGKVIAEKVQGTVKWFNVRNGYGFISRNDNQQDVFVHQTSITKNNPKKYLRSVGDDEVVEFDVVEGQKGLEAANVTGPDGAPVEGSRYAPERRPRFNRGGYRGRGRGGRGRGRGYRGGGGYYRGGPPRRGPRRSSETAEEERSDQEQDEQRDERPRTRGVRGGRGRGRGGRYNRYNYRQRQRSESGNDYTSQDDQDRDQVRDQDDRGSRRPRRFRQRQRRPPPRSSDDEDRRDDQDRPDDRDRRDGRGG